MLGLRLERLETCVEPVMPFDLLEMAIISLLHRREGSFYFVQVGASDGIRNDYLHPLVRRYALVGCLVEPDRDLFRRLKSNYADQAQLEFRNVRIGAGDETATGKPGAPVQSFAAFAATLPAMLIDLLYVDTEGADDEVIRSVLDAGIHPDIIHYEWSEMSIERRCDLKMLLLAHRYRFIDIGADTVCYRLRDDHAH